MSKKTTPTLESALSEITQLIEKMEKGDLTLEQSLAHFERGIHLIKYSQTLLTSAEQKVQILLQNQGAEQLTPYTPNQEEGTKGHD